MKFELSKENIVPPYDFNYNLSHYNIYPWIKDGNSLIRVLRLNTGSSYVVKITSKGTIEKPLLLIEVKPSKSITDRELSEIKDTIIWCLSLNEDYRAFYKLCQKDEILKVALTRRYGSKNKIYPTIFEALIGVICAQNIQFKRLYTMMYNLCAKFGNKITIDNNDYFAFPLPEEISRADLLSVRECKVGYRDKFIKGIADHILKSDINLEHIKELPLEESLKELMKLPGVGPYTANLVLSSGTHRKDIIHLDRYVREAMYVFYFNNRKVSDKELIAFSRENWHGFEGLVIDLLTTDTELWSQSLNVNFRFKSGAIST